jgi:hypothetical protein
MRAIEFASATLQWRLDAIADETRPANGTYAGLFAPEGSRWQSGEPTARCES